MQLSTLFKLGNTMDRENLCHPICTQPDPKKEKKVEAYSAFYKS